MNRKRIKKRRRRTVGSYGFSELEQPIRVGDARMFGQMAGVGAWGSHGERWWTPITGETDAGRTFGDYRR